MMYIIEPGWVKLSLLKKYLSECNISYRYGPRENKTDGEANWILTAHDGQEQMFSTNYYDGESWYEMVQWVKNIQAKIK